MNTLIIAFNIYCKFAQDKNSSEKNFIANADRISVEFEQRSVPLETLNLRN